MENMSQLSVGTEGLISLKILEAPGTASQHPRIKLEVATTIHQYQFQTMALWFAWWLKHQVER
jgi:hypothetical protein